LANVLEKIVIDKKAEIAQRKIDFPLSDFKDQLTPSKKDFYGALKAPNASFILECKKASPSKGLIREHFDLDEIIDAYSKYASCISVLTDEKYFQGKFEYLQYVTERVEQPVINKDFFVDPYQIYLARYYNADAVLLMLSVLNDHEYAELSALAESLSLAVLTEVSNEEEVHRALKLKANIIGINNRNLRDLSTDLATTERLVPIIKESGFKGAIISESGIYTHQEVRRLSPHVDAFLVGSALMAQDNLALAIETLLYGEVKVCGVTSLDQARMIAKYPTSYLGLIFVEQSPRFVDDSTALTISQNIDKPLVGVFQNHEIKAISEKVKRFGLAVVQLHGDESEHYVATLKAELRPQCQIWKAVGVENEDDLKEIDSRYQHVDKLLLDTKVGAQSGGTGQTFDWRWLSQICENTRIALAGGISPDNANQARLSKAQIIDVNSGIESQKGVKDPAKLDALFDAIREY
jgi:indole-3-glycerol phosphate synthase/phosphoribosylanthranilate isomerase